MNAPVHPAHKPVKEKHTDMKVVILCGGFGTRIAEESHLKPKPMIEVGEMPILWHIMKHYSYYGYNDFIICAGYKQNMIKEWFSNYYFNTADVTFDFTDGNRITYHDRHAEPWKVTVVDTGLYTKTGGRVKRVRRYVGDEPFMLTYGDAVGDIDLRALEAFHRSHGKIGTVSVYNYGQSKGVLDVGINGTVTSFREKSNMDGDLINIGFMVMNPEIFDRIEGDDTVFEQEPLVGLVRDKELSAFTHHGFWQCMDTVREKLRLEQLWSSGSAPWKLWS